MNITNAALELGFVDSASGPRLATVRNRGTGAELNLANPTGVVLVVEAGGRQVVLQQADLTWAAAERQESGLAGRWTATGSGLALTVTPLWTLNGPVASLHVQVTNTGAAAILVRDVILLSATTAATGDALAVEVREGAGDAGRFQARAQGAFDANPIFLQDCFFVGIDWPVAENRSENGQLLCRQFPGVELAAGATWESQTLSIGVAAQGGLPTAFLKHLDVKRGRPTRRASFYFDWLIHASEGPTQEETRRMLDLLELLRRDYGVQFDIYAVDDGAVESRWELMYDRYQLRHRTLYPAGFRVQADRMKALGMDPGVWLGPDVVYRNDETDGQRRQDILDMVRDWQVGLFKLDVCVSVPLKEDPYYNDRYMTRLAELYRAAREINPRLVVINHRIRFSPYMLTILDSTLWESAESYAEVVLGNGDKPRLYTRFGAYQRGEPTYYGAYSPLLEDHGMCFNGDWRGWRNEFVLGAFGRALALSPEIYGTLFLLPDEEYAELGRLMQLARANRELLANTSYRAATGDFVHSDGTQCLVCVVNDAWEAAHRTLDRAALGLPATGSYAVEVFHPADGACVAQRTLAAGEALHVNLPAFGIAAIKLVSGKGVSTAARPVPVETLRLTGPIAATAWDENDTAQIAALEQVRFAADSDVLEHQALRRLQPSRHPEVNACRAWFEAKQHRDIAGIAAHAWDGDPTTIWGDDGIWRYSANIWRLDLGCRTIVGLVEIQLAQIFPGPILPGGNVRNLDEPLFMEVSDDLVHWTSRQAFVFYRRRPVGPDSAFQIVADFSGTPARYLRIHAHGFYCSALIVRTPDGAPIPTGDWHGNNRLTARQPVQHAAVELTAGLQTVIREQAAGLLGEATLALVVRLGPERRDLNQEQVLAWLTVGAVTVPLMEASPMLPCHRWEWDCSVRSNGATFRVDLPAGAAADLLARGQVTAHVVAFTAEELKAALPQLTVEALVVPYRIGAAPA